MLMPALAQLGLPLGLLSTLAEAAPAAEEKAPPIIDLDGTVVLQFILFVVMYLVLRRFFFLPYLRMREERTAHIEGAEKRAAGLSDKRKSIESEYQQRLQKARASADEERARLQAEARAREAELLTQARGRAQQRVNETHKAVAAQVAAAQAELEKQAEPIARSLAHKLLGREV
jgi:F-type H+-transporting ATPase subunit b